MFEIWTKQFGQVARAANYTDGCALLKEYAAKAGASVAFTFTGGFFTDDEGRRYVLRTL